MCPSVLARTCVEVEVKALLSCVMFIPPSATNAGKYPLLSLTPSQRLQGLLSPLSSPLMLGNGYPRSLSSCAWVV
jgi:hypothetical protein